MLLLNGRRMAEDYDMFKLAGVLSMPTDAFQNLTGPYQRELLLHCYRILGSLEDAEDALQETLLRAWRRFDTLKEQSSLRAWLYKIATNVSLDLLARHKARSMPSVLFPPANPHAPLPGAVDDPIWLEPIPEETIAGRDPNPEAQVEAHESVSLAFLAILQTLPGRQRAALILCDVLDWKAQEAAQMLDLSLAAVNSALQRARATLKKDQAKAVLHTRPATGDPQTGILLNRYIQAWEAADAAGLASLLREDATLTMPPLPAWYFGREAIRTFFETHLFAGKSQGSFRLLLTRANDSPALAVYQRDEQGEYRPASIQVITLDGGQIAQVDCFLVVDEQLFNRFKLPISI